MKGIRSKLVNTGLLMIAGAMLSCGTIDVNQGLVPEQEVAVLEIRQPLSPLALARGTSIILFEIDGQKTSAASVLMIKRAGKAEILNLD